jgi:hypothetical protein
MNANMLTLGFEDIIVSNFIIIAIFVTILYMEMRQICNN